MKPCDVCAIKDECQPYGGEFQAADGVWIKEMCIPKAGTIVPQHSHEYDHTSYLAKGSVSFEGHTYHAPVPIYIKAGVMHTFISLQDDTLVLCIHNISRTGSVQVAAENSIDKVRISLEAR